MTQTAFTDLPTPTNCFAGLSVETQMILLRADMKSIRSVRGPLRQQGPFVRAHFVYRLADVRKAQAQAA